MEKLAIVEYFDSVINQIDLITETKIQQDQRLEDFYNERRQKQIETVREIEQRNLLRLETGQTKEISEGFCFVFEFIDTWFLVTTNKQITPEEIEFLGELLKWNSRSHSQRLKSFFDIEKPDGNEPIIEIKYNFDLSPFKTIECSVIDVGPWFDCEFIIEELKIDYSMSLRFDHKPITSLLRIKTLIIEAVFNDTDEPKTTAEFLQHAVKGFGRADQVTIELYCFCTDNTKIEELVELLRSSNINEKLCISIRIDLDNRIISKDASFLPYLSKIDLTQSTLSMLSKINWSYVKEVQFTIILLKDLESADFSTLRSLRTLYICCKSEADRSKCAIDWTFLDPVRDNLEKLILGRIETQHLSWKAFRGMHQLQKLEILDSQIEIIELNDQRQLFADLHALKELDIQLSLAMMTTEWILDLPNLEKLTLRPVLTLREYLNSDRASILIGFKMPKLITLYLRLNDFPDTKNISSLTKQFCSVQELQLDICRLSYMKNGYFREFKSLKKLQLTFLTQRAVVVDSEAFIGLEQLVELIMENALTQPGSLSQLKNLEIIRLKSVDLDKEYRVEDDYKSHFNGLVSLKELTIDRDDVTCYYYFQLSPLEKFLFYENLNKFVLETRFFENPKTEFGFDDDDESFDSWEYSDEFDDDEEFDSDESNYEQ